MKDTNENIITKHTDLTYLRGLAKSSEAFIIQMLNIYVSQTPTALELIENALTKKDWTSLRLAVHKLKPSAMFVGLNEIIYDISLLEDYAAVESHLDEITRLVNKIKLVCSEAIPELQEELKKLK
jgi:HPt (histidine-containing phosphotransfer) domain-containing protein